ncbi:lipase maturation factor 1-like [Ornithodoros turicata]|uniref:lipase maturation factor 1-like n=1 Tax=Ornithodoros turicata TaxID=34597 RepID=UPI0031397BBF
MDNEYRRKFSERPGELFSEGCRKRPEAKLSGAGDSKSSERSNVKVRPRTARKSLKHAFDEAAKFCEPPSGSYYWLTRIVFLRALGFLYAVAFLIALNQNEYLIGRNGLLPADLFMNAVKEHAHGLNIQAITQVPSILWFFNFEDIDFYLNAIAMAGFLLSSTVAITGAANAVTMLVLWILYHSIVNVGQRWYSFGWESQLLETGFLAIFFCPLFKWKQLPRGTPPSWVVVWGYRWLLFRIMLGAGLIKIRGDKCWKTLTCMNYHYETQPVPNPISYYLHQSPSVIHMTEVLGNHLIELVVPWFLFMTRPFILACGAIQITFQVILIISGNLSFLNWLTILPAIPYFDDRILKRLFNERTKTEAAVLAKDESTGIIRPSKLLHAFEVGACHYYEVNFPGRVRRFTNMSLALCLAFLSIPVVINLLSPHQHMNTSFEPLRIVNTYGAFGSVTKVRKEVILQGTSDNPNNPVAKWEEYEFKCKPGNVFRRPCLISPYHYRLDWIMWFAGFQNYQQNPWLVHLSFKLLSNDETATALIANNPFVGRKPPKFIRAEHYRYRYARFGSPEARVGQWWTRERVGNYMPPVSIETLKPVMEKFGWNRKA